MALLAAAKSGDSAEVARLLEGGADVFHKDMDGWSCLLWASSNGHLDVARMLVEKGGEGLLMAKDTNGRPCLHFACSNGHLDVARMLVEMGGEGLLMAQSKHGRTCLHLASENGHLDLARMLVEKGGEGLLMAKNIDGKTALDFARKYGRTKVAEMLEGATTSKPWESCGCSLPAPGNTERAIRVPWKEVQPITGQDHEAAASFAKSRIGEAKEKESDTRKRQAARIEEARSSIAKLSSLPSADMQAASHALVKGCIIDSEGSLALDLRALCSEEGGLAEALSQHLPLLVGRCIASELRGAAPVALKMLQASADAASEKVTLHSQALTRAEEIKRKWHEEMKVHRRRVTVTSGLLDCSASVCSCYEDQSGEGMLRSLQKGQENAKKALQALAEPLAEAVKRQEAARKDKAAADKRVRDFSTRLDKMASGLRPLSSEEKGASDEALLCLKQAAQAAAEHLERNRSDSTASAVS